MSHPDLRSPGPVDPAPGYPEPQYLGEAGEVTATYRPAVTPPDLTYESGTAVHYLSTGAGTGGLFGLYRWDMGPTHSGPDPHFHRTITESFFVLSGTVAIYDGQRWVDTGPGDWVHVPAGGVHGFKNTSDAPASMLIHFSPGAPREGYFQGLPALADLSEDERAAFYLRHDNHWV